MHALLSLDTWLNPGMQLVMFLWAFYWWFGRG